jgi:hypothetical protein
MSRLLKHIQYYDSADTIKVKTYFRRLLICHAVIVSSNQYKQAVTVTNKLKISALLLRITCVHAYVLCI